MKEIKRRARFSGLVHCPIDQEEKLIDAKNVSFEYSKKDNNVLTINSENDTGINCDKIINPKGKAVCNKTKEECVLMSHVGNFLSLVQLEIEQK